MMTTSVAGATEAVRPAARPARDTFYADLTQRNLGLIDDREQHLLRQATILVAGCGSIGGAVVEPLVRLGAERLILAEPDVYEMHNLNRQQAALADVGRNKALVLAERVGQINPYADVHVDDRGITADNVAAHVAAATLIFDGIDVTTRPALAAKYALHEQAHRSRVPAICGYDIAGTQLVIVYDYRTGSTNVLNGRLAGRPIEDLDPLQFLARVVPLRALPVEIFPVLRNQLRGESSSFPQLVYTAQLFGVLACRVGLDLLAGRPVRHRITVDVHALTRTPGRRRRARWTRIVELALMSRTALSYRQ